MMPQKLSNLINDGGGPHAIVFLKIDAINQLTI
jgi:hypothetical protein